MLGARSARKKVLSYTSCPQDFMQPFYGHTQQTKQKRDYLVVLELILDQSKWWWKYSSGFVCMIPVAHIRLLCLWLL